MFLGQQKKHRPEKNKNFVKVTVIFVVFGHFFFPKPVPQKKATLLLDVEISTMPLNALFSPPVYLPGVQVTDTAVLGHIGKSPLGNEGTRYLDATALSDLWNLSLQFGWVKKVERFGYNPGSRCHHFKNWWFLLDDDKPLLK